MGTYLKFCDVPKLVTTIGWSKNAPLYTNLLTCLFFHLLDETMFMIRRSDQLFVTLKINEFRLVSLLRIKEYNPNEKCSI